MRYLHTFTAAIFVFLAAGAWAQQPPADAPATAPTSAPSADANPFPSIADLQQMLADGKNAQVIQKTTRLIFLKGRAANGYNRLDLLKLKAEAQLRQKLFPAAMVTLNQLAKETNSDVDRQIAQATVILIQKSPGGRYLPKTLPPGSDKAPPIDIADPATRPAAFEALFTDERAALEPKLNDAIASRMLPPIYPVIEGLMGLRSLDVAASGSDARTVEQVAKVVEYAKRLLSSAVKDMSNRIDDIDHAANTDIVVYSIVMNPATGQYLPPVHQRQGLTDRTAGELRSMIPLADKIAAAADALGKIEADAQAELNDVISDARRDQDHAKDLLETDFNGHGAAGMN